MWCLGYHTEYIRRGVCSWREREDHSPPEKGRGQRRENSDFSVPREISSFSGHWREGLIDIELSGEYEWIERIYSYVCMAVCMDGWIDLRLARGGYDYEWYIHINTYSKGEHYGVPVTLAKPGHLHTGLDGAVQPPNVPVYLHWVVGRGLPDMGKSCSVSQCSIPRFTRKVLSAHAL